MLANDYLKLMEYLKEVFWEMNENHKFGHPARHLFCWGSALF